MEEDKFRIILDVRHFKPEEVRVKLCEGRVVQVEGKCGQQGNISRHFIRKYVLPPDYDLKKIKSTLASDGVLVNAAPKSGSRRNTAKGKVIPVLKIDKPFKQVDKNANLKHKL